VATRALKSGIRTMAYLGPDGEHLKYEWCTKAAGVDHVTMVWRDRDARMTRVEYGDPAPIVWTFQVSACSISAGVW